MSSKSKAKVAKSQDVMEQPTTETKRRGRPSNPDSARSKRLAAQAERVANGETIHRGRPRKQKESAQ